MTSRGDERTQGASGPARRDSSIADTHLNTRDATHKMIAK